MRRFIENAGYVVLVLLVAFSPELLILFLIVGLVWLSRHW